VGFFIVVLLILANAFFVASEFALVAARSTRIDRLAAAGSQPARLVQRAKSNPTPFFSATQTGVTLASLLLGWVGEQAVAGVLDQPMEELFQWLYDQLGLGFLDPHTSGLITANAIASVLAIVIITFFHITLGEQVPKLISLQQAERIILFNIRPMVIIGWLFRPFVWLLTITVTFLLRLLHVEYHGEEQAVHSPEELQLLVAGSARAGLMSAPERELVDRAFAFSDLTAAEVMVPRTEVIALPADATVQDAIRAALRYRHSRFPIYEGSIDNVVGVLSTKDLLSVAARRATRAAPTADTVSLRRLARPPLFVTEGAEVSEVLARVKAARQPMAIVLDEYGGTAGIVTLKDLVARLVGEMGDEYAQPVHEVRVLPDGSVLVDGLALIEDVNAELHTHFDASEVDTMGGLVFSRLGRRPQIGDEVDVGGGYRARVERLDGLRIARIRLLPAGADTAPKSSTDESLATSR
jgi:CBS domain containing-hemolysin-like protein